MKSKNIFICMVLVGVVLMGAQSAFADVTAVYKMTMRDGNGTQTIRYADKNHVRVDMASEAMHHEAIMMKLGDKVYAITGKVVQDMGQLSAMMAAMGKGGKGRHKAHDPIKYKDTGRTETVAGIKGKVYRFIEHGKKHELVLGQDKDLQAAMLGVVEIAKSSNGMMPDDFRSQIQQDAFEKSMAMLRLDNIMLLQSLNKKHIQDSVFDLPSKPQQFGGAGLEGLMRGMMGK